MNYFVSTQNKLRLLDNTPKPQNILFKPQFPYNSKIDAFIFWLLFLVFLLYVAALLNTTSTVLHSRGYLT